MRIRRWFVRSIVLVIILVIFFGILKLPILSVAIGAISGVTRVVVGSLSAITARVPKAVSTIWHASRVARELGELKTQVRVSTEAQAQLSELERENAELRRTLQFVTQEQYPLTAARIIGRFREAGIDFFVLNRGARDGIEVDAPVVVGNTLIAKIVKVQPSLSVASPLWAAAIKTAATFAGSDKNAGIIMGELNTGLTMQLIPKDIAVRQDMVVITSGLEQKIPRGLTIGKVARTEETPDELFQSAFINPLISAGEVTIVGIITSYAAATPAH